MKREAVDSSLAEQQRDQEAALAEGAAQDCLIAQHEATVRAGDPLHLHAPVLPAPFARLPT